MPRGRKTSRRGRRSRGPTAVRRGLIAALALLFLAAGVQVARYMIRSADTRREEARMRAEIDRAGGAMEGVSAGAAEGVSGGASESASTGAAEAVSTGASDATSIVASDATSIGASRPGRAAGEPVDLEVMFAAPLQRNPDTVGALEAGSDIKTWVVQRADNTYYLTHSFEGKKNSAGAVFLDACCALRPASRNLVVYGHNMYDGTAFTRLRDFRREAYLNVFPVIRFATRHEDARYAIFAVFDFSVDGNSRDYFDPAHPDFASEGDFLIFADLAKARSILPVPVDVAAGDSLITLVTCDESDKNGRFAVMARKLRPGEAPEDFANPVDGAVRELRYTEGLSLMSGPDVTQIQEALRALDYFQGGCDGVYGWETAGAVLAFQRDHGLAPDGIAGAETREKLLDAAKG